MLIKLMQRWAIYFSAFIISTTAFGTSLISKNEALSLVFNQCKIVRQTVYLTRKEKTEVERLSGYPLASAIIHPYQASCPDGNKGTAYFDIHPVRTLSETLMIALNHKDQVMRVEVLDFREPKEYLPRKPWYNQFLGQSLTPNLSLKRQITGVTGATLTSRAVTRAVRRVLAIHTIIKKKNRQ